MASSQQQQQAVEGIEKVYATLQPIRDLARNWDIDIAACLEDYLRECGFSEETREQVTASLNFAQAALVLQNSSGVYSRKVDYLHSHVYKVQEELSLSLISAQHNSNAGKKANGKLSRGIDQEIEAFLNFDPDQEFLLLDDVLPTDSTDQGRKINLDVTDDNVNGDSNVSMQTTGTTRLSLGSSVQKRLSLNASQNSNNTTVNSNTFLDTTRSNHNQAHLLTILGAAQDTATLRLAAGGGVGEAGVLLLLGGTGSQTSTTTEGAAPDPQRYSSSGSNNPMDVGDNDVSDFGGGADCFDDGMDDDDHDGPVCHLTDDENYHGSAETAATLQEKKRVTFSDCTTAPLSPPKRDPWECLDRDTTDRNSKPRLLRVGKTIVLPDTLDTLPSECVTGSRTRRVARNRGLQRQYHLKKKQQQQLSTVETFQVTLGKRSLEDVQDGNNNNNNNNNNNGSSSDALNQVPSISFKGLAFGDEFSYIVKAKAKRQADERRALRQQQHHDQGRTSLCQGQGPENDLGDDGNGFAFGDGGEYNDEDDAYVYGGGDDGDCTFGDDDNNGSRGPILSNTGLASVDDVFQYNNNDDDPNQHHRTFEELCRAHIKAFARGAEKYAAETKLTTRVQQWQEKLLPILEMEERRPPFDIHAYGNAVIQSMEYHIDQERRKCLDSDKTDDTLKAKHDSIVDFRDMVEGCDSFEVCRRFLATLSLNSWGNVHFLDPQQDNGSSDSLKVKLLSTDIERPMENYVAPSVQNEAGP